MLRVFLTIFFGIASRRSPKGPALIVFAFTPGPGGDGELGRSAARGRGAREAPQRYQGVFA